MTAYASRDDLELQFGAVNITDWSSLDGIVVEGDVTAKVAESIVEAQETIDGLLRKGPYTIPFTVVPGPIKRLAAVLAGAWLHRSRGLVNVEGSGDDSLAKAIVNLEDRALARLMDIKAGRFSLDDDSEVSMSPEIVVFKINEDREVLPPVLGA